MKLPKKYQGITPGEWTPHDLDEWAKNICTKEGEDADGTERFWAVASVNCRRAEAKENLVLVADSPRLAAAVVELREALEPFANYACDGEGAGHCHNCTARAALASTKEWEA